LQLRVEGIGGAPTPDPAAQVAGGGTHPAPGRALPDHTPRSPGPRPRPESHRGLAAALRSARASRARAPRLSTVGDGTRDAARPLPRGRRARGDLAARRAAGG